jgi:hypothetical protein
MANFNGDDYSFEEDDTCYEEIENDGGQEDRVRFYKGVVYDEEDYDEESLNLWANQRFKQKRAGRAVAVDLPREKKEQELQEERKEQEEEVKLNLPEGGWKVQSIISNETLPTLLESKITVSVAKKKSFFSKPSENAWKKMPNFFEGLTVVDQLATLADPPRNPSKDPPRDPHPPPQSYKEREDDGFKQVRSAERRPRLMQQSNVGAQKKPLEKPQNLKNTKMCKAGEKCSRRATCNFAHTLEEFNPVFCNFQKNCKNFERCGFRHEWESKEGFLSRVNAM